MIDNSTLALRRFVGMMVIAAASVATGTSSWAAGQPETVVVTFHVKAGKANELKQLLWRSWATYQRLQLVLAEPHILARNNEENGEATFFEFFSWKSHAIPDTAPTEVRELWNQMESLCEPRNGQPGIDFVEVDILQPETGKPPAAKSEDE